MPYSTFSAVIETKKKADNEAETKNYSKTLTEVGKQTFFTYRRPTLYTLQIAVDFLKSL